MTDFEIVIVGGGMVGATLGCALAREGRNIAVVEAREPAPFDPADDYDLRVSALSRASQRIFESLGVWDGVVSRRASPYEHMHVWDATGDGEIHFDCAELDEPNLGHIVENRVIQDALLEVLKAHDNVTWLCPASISALEVQAQQAVLTLDDGRRVSARLVVGADGARSRLRELAGIEVERHAYGQRGVVANVATDKSHQSTAWQRFLPTGPLAFLPLGDGRCSIVWSADDARAEAIMAMDDETFRRELAAALGHRLGPVVDTTPRAAFPLAGSQASEYVRPRVALVGDAAHTIHPLAGQGANLGFLDAAALADVVAQAGDDPGVMAMLRRYERARRGDDILMMRAMEGFKLLFGNELGPLAWLRNTGLKLADRAGPVKHELIRRAMGLSGELPALARGK